MILLLQLLALMKNSTINTFIGFIDQYVLFSTEIYLESACNIYVQKMFSNDFLKYLSFPKVIFEGLN